ncbi:MAG: hypothetical protein HOP96_11225 [Sphingomonas sp.]|nr:hypothetical protein [Sphingomonas sp.]
MKVMTKVLAGGAGLAALATAVPAAAQYYAQPYGYGYTQYGSPYGYGSNVTQMAAQRCAAAVQNRLSQPRGLGGILGAVLGARTSGSGRVLSVTQINPRRSTVSVRGLASSGANYGYGQYGYGAYGAAGYGYQPDLSFRCSVDYQGYIRDVDIMRR